MFALAKMFKATICFCVAPCEESAPVLKLWATKAAAERIVEALVRSAQTYFFAVSQDDSNYCKHVIKQDLLFFSELALQAQPTTGSKWLTVYCASKIPLLRCSIAAITGVDDCFSWRTLLLYPVAGNVEVHWMSALCWGLTETSISPRTATSDPSPDSRPKTNKQTKD